jgi:hypothetical protein
MNYTYIINILENNSTTFKSLLDNISKEQAQWKPSPEKWSQLENRQSLY